MVTQALVGIVVHQEQVVTQALVGIVVHQALVVIQALVGIQVQVVHQEQVDILVHQG